MGANMENCHGCGEYMRPDADRCRCCGRRNPPPTVTENLLAPITAKVSGNLLGDMETNAMADMLNEATGYAAGTALKAAKMVQEYRDYATRCAINGTYAEGSRRFYERLVADYRL